MVWIYYHSQLFLITITFNVNLLGYITKLLIGIYCINFYIFSIHYKLAQIICSLFSHVKTVKIRLLLISRWRIDCNHLQILLLPNCWIYKNAANMFSEVILKRYKNYYHGIEGHLIHLKPLINTAMLYSKFQLKNRSVTHEHIFDEV